MTTEQTVDKIIEARNEHLRGNIDTTELVTRIGNAVNEAKEEAEKRGEKNILDSVTVGWDVDIKQVDGTVCKWRLIEITK
jgi:hypothetical protein